jgi:N-methylhydantoinase B
VRSKDRVDLKAGDILTLYSSGGGGYGPAAERNPRLVDDDVRQGYVTAAAASELYGWTEHT